MESWVLTDNRDKRVYTGTTRPTCILINSVIKNFPESANCYAVNIGAGDGRSCNDPVYPLFAAGYSGVAIEAEINCELAKNIPSEKVRKIIGVPVTPFNIEYLLRSSGCPRDPDFLKIDVDGYDGVIFKSILEAGFLPKVLQIEVNPEFPPPIQFSVMYDTRYSCAIAGGFYGASLAFCVNIARQYGYSLCSLDFFSAWTHDIVLIQEKYSHVAVEAMGVDFRGKDLREIYLDHPAGYSHFAEIGIDTFAWRYRTDYHNLITEIWSACMTANIKKHGNWEVPFTLSL